MKKELTKIKHQTEVSDKTQQQR